MQDLKNAPKRTLKLKINKVDNIDGKNHKRLELIKQKNKFNKMIMGLEVSIKKEMMHLDAEDSIVSSITGNKVNFTISKNFPYRQF